jgi:outer membrane protein assembly factor BamB
MKAMQTKTTKTAKATTRRVRIGAVLAAATLLLGGGVLLLGGRERSERTNAVRLLPHPPVAGPSPSLTWWTPVHGEPLGVAVEGTDVVAAALDEVRLLEGERGRTRWKATFPGVRRYRPALGAERVAATSETELLVLDRADGARVAVVPFAGPGPAAVLAGRDGRPVVVAGSETGALLTVDGDTGSTLWSAAFPGQVTVAPQGDAGLVVASWNDAWGATLRAFDLASGAPRWEVRLGVMAGAPALGSGTVLVPDGEGIHAARIRALDLRTGQDRWQTPLSGWFDDELEPAVDETTGYILDGMGSVVALDLATGAVRWRQDTGRPLVDGRVVLTPGGVVFASYDDELLVLDRATGRLRAVEQQRGVPVDVAALADRLVVALRLGSPSRVEARPEP